VVYRAVWFVSDGRERPTPAIWSRAFRLVRRAHGRDRPTPAIGSRAFRLVLITHGRERPTPAIWSRAFRLVTTGEAEMVRLNFHALLEFAVFEHNFGNVEQENDIHETIRNRKDNSVPMKGEIIDEVNTQVEIL
jgi:hypothetical protein